MRGRKGNFMNRVMHFGSFFGQRRPRAGRPLALALALSLLLPTIALLPAAPASAQGNGSATAADLAAVRIPTVPVSDGPIHTILMFPFANKIDANASANGFDADTVGARVENAVKLRLNEIGRYKADSFTPTLPQIQRAVEDSGVNGLTEADVAPPYDSSQRGRKLADEIATDGYLLGTIEGIKTDEQSRTVSLTVTATLYSTQTGRAVKAFAYTGHGISYNTIDDPAALLQSAINDVAGHVVSALNANLAQVPVKRDVRVRHKNGVGQVALGLLLAAAIAIGITASHHISHHNSTGTTTTTPVTPVPVTGGGPPTPPGGL